MGNKRNPSRLLDAIKARAAAQVRVLEAAHVYGSGRGGEGAILLARAMDLGSADREVEAAKRSVGRRLRRLRKKTEEARNG